MSNKAIGPKTHGALDYGFVTLQALAPSLFGLKGDARTLCYCFALTQGIINTFTDHPLALKPIIPLHVHGQLTNYLLTDYKACQRNISEKERK